MWTAPGSIAQVSACSGSVGKRRKTAKGEAPQATFGISSNAVLKAGLYAISAYNVKKLDVDRHQP